MPAQIDRRTFDAILNEFFPNAHRIRREPGGQWHDVFDIGCLRVRVAVQTVAFKRKVGGKVRSEGHITVSLLGLRGGTDNSEALLRRYEETGIKGLRTALMMLRRDLVGVAAGILTACGDERPVIAEDPDFPF